MDNLPVINLNPPKTRLAIAVASGMKQKDAFKEAFGHEPANRQEIQNAVRSVKHLTTAITTDINEELKNNATDALNTIIQLMSDGAVPANVRMQCAKDILDRAGYNPTNKVANVTSQYKQITLTDSEKLELRKALDNLKS